MAIAADSGLQQQLVSKHLPGGLHIGSHAKQGGPDNEQLLAQDGYIMWHDGDLRTAVWTAHKLIGDEVTAGDGKDRINCFRTDPRLNADHAANKSDYDEPVFDQGHMTNDRDLRDDAVEQMNTYVLSNMSAQHCRLNRGIWLTLEYLGRDWAKAYDVIYITNGAIFDFNSRDARDKDKSAARMGSRNQKGRVAVPSHYYKNFMRKEDGQWLSISFVVENHNGPRGRAWADVGPHVMAAITTMDAIEERSEVSLHPSIDRAQITESINGAGWVLNGTKDNLETGCPS